MIHGSVCVAMVVCQQACGGHSSTFSFVSRSLPSISTFSQLSLSILCLPFVLRLYHSPLFLSLFLVLMRSLIAASLCSLSFSLSHPLSSSSSSRYTISLLVDTHFLSFTPSFFLVPRAHFCCLSATSLFCVGFLIDTEPSSAFKSTWNKMYTHYHQAISGLTFFLLHLFLIHCISILQQGIISMAIHTRALSGCC